MTFKKPIAGEPANLILSESFQSALVDVVNAHQRGELTRKETEIRKDHVVTVKNASGADVKAGELLAIEQDVTPPAYADTVQSFVQNPLVIGNAVTWHSNIGYVAVATQPILQDMLGPCSFRPFGQVQADIGGAGDWLMVNPTNPQQFKRSTGGIARVIAFDATTGKCVADFLEQQPLWRYELISDVSNLLGVANLIDLGGAVYATVTVRFTNSTKVAGDAGFCLHTGNHFDAIESAATIASAPTPRFRFRLKTDFDDTGQADAYVLDVFGNVTLPNGSPVQLGDVLRVHDPRKCFAHAIGADSLALIQGIDPFFPAGGSIGYAVKTNQLKTNPTDPDDPQYPRWEVEQCTQVINRLRVMIDRGQTGELPTGELNETEKRLVLTPDEAVVSQWPYVDYPPELLPPEGSRTYWAIEATNPHRFSAGDGWAIIERVQKGCRAEDATNVDTPYTANTLYTAEWQIVEVENPIARWVCAEWAGISAEHPDGWELQGALTYLEGEDPVVANYFATYQLLSAAVRTAPCLEMDCLAVGQPGIAFWDPNSQFYNVVATNSALYGSAKQLEVIGRYSTDPPDLTTLIRFGNALDGEDPCGLHYKRTEPVRVFGGSFEGPPNDCTPVQSERVVPSNMIAVDVVANVVRTGEELCFTYDTVYVCRTDTGVSDDCINVCCPEPTGCCEYPPGTYTPGVTQSACTAQGGTWTLGDCPADDCFGCSFCDTPGGGVTLQLQQFEFAAGGSVSQGGVFNIQTTTQTSGCTAVVTGYFTPLTGGAQTPASCTMTLQSDSSSPSGYSIRCVWSPSQVYGCTLDADLYSGAQTPQPDPCNDSYGYAAGGVNPPNPPEGNSWTDYEATATPCTP